MKTVLYIDTFSHFGHTNLNLVYLREFEKAGYEVFVIVRDSYINELNINAEQVLISIPEHFYDLEAGTFKYRFLQWKILRYIKKRISFNKFDLVFFSFFEEISYSLAGIKGKFVFMNHYNVEGLNNCIKRFFIKYVSKLGTILVFHQSIKDQYYNYRISNVVVRPLGLSKPYLINKNISIDPKSDIQNKLNSEEYNLKLFIPTASKYGDDFINGLLNNNKFCNFLSENKIFIISKGLNLVVEKENIYSLNRTLTSEEYKTLFTSVDFIFLHYPITFQFKVSALLFECFSNNKPCIVNDIPSFTNFRNYFAYNPYYSTQESLEFLLLDILKNRKSIAAEPYINLDELNPDLKTII